MEFVRQVLDGDTFETSAAAPNVRLDGVWAPELSTQNGPRAKLALERLIHHELVTLEVVDMNYGRRVARVWRTRDGLCVNDAMIELVRGL